MVQGRVGEWDIEEINIIIKQIIGEGESLKSKIDRTIMMSSLIKCL